MKTATGAKDPLYDQARKLVLEKKYVSISALQRGLRISYSHAMRLMNELEGDVVTRPDAAGHRQLISAS